MVSFSSYSQNENCCHCRPYETSFLTLVNSQFILKLADLLVKVRIFDADDYFCINHMNMEYFSL